MGSDVMGTLAAVGGLAEIALFALAGLVLFRRWGYTLAEAAALAALLPAMLVSFLLQVGFLAAALDQIRWVLALAGVACLVCTWRERRVIGRLWLQAVRFSRDHPLAVGGLLLALGLLLAAAVASSSPVTATVGGDLVAGGGWRVTSSGPLGSAPSQDQALAPLNTLILDRMFAGRAVGPATGLFAWSAYLSICFATYALCRRYAWPPTAISVTLLVVSMPRLVFQAVSSGAEIIPAAAALLFVLLLYRTVERPDVKDLLMMLLMLAFSISGGRMCLVFPAVGLGLAAVVLFRRHGGRIWWDMLFQAPLAGLAAVVPFLIFSQTWLIGLNTLAGKNWVGSPPGVDWAYNADGLAGFAGNLVRYGLQVLDLTPAGESLAAWVFGINWGVGLQWLHDRLLPTALATRGLAAPFAVCVPPQTDLAWFGPFAGFLMLPALGWAFVKGARRLKALALALGAYFLLVALIPAWMPGNARYFTVFFVCGGCTVAFLLPPWRMTHRRRCFLQLTAIALLALATAAVLQGAGFFRMAPRWIASKARASIRTAWVSRVKPFSQKNGSLVVKKQVGPEFVIIARGNEFRAYDVAVYFANGHLPVDGGLKFIVKIETDGKPLPNLQRWLAVVVRQSEAHPALGNIQQSDGGAEGPAVRGFKRIGSRQGDVFSKKPAALQHDAVGLATSAGPLELNFVIERREAADILYHLFAAGLAQKRGLMVVADEDLFHFDIARISTPVERSIAL